LSPVPGADPGRDGDEPRRGGEEYAEEEGPSCSKKTKDELSQSTERWHRVPGDGPGRGHIEEEGLGFRFWPKDPEDLAELWPHEESRNQKMSPKEQKEGSNPQADYPKT
jgi:hypothetical protein